MGALESTILFDLGIIAQVILIDLALGGDNSIVIGMAAKNLPPHLQKRAIIYGTAGAIALRLLLALIVSWLFQIPFLKTVGGILLIGIGIKLIGAQDQKENIKIEAKDSLWAAVRTIILADALMSLDNVLGIVGVTDNHWALLLFGMLISVPIIILGSTIVVKIMNRFPLLMYIGGAILGWAAGGMLATDHYLAAYMPFFATNSEMIKIVLLIITIGGGLAWKHIHHSQSAVAE